MRTFAFAIFMLLLTNPVAALDRSDLPDNPNAINPGSVTMPEGGELVVTNQRDVTVFDNLDDFLAVLDSEYYFDDFEWLDWGTISSETYTFGPVNGYSYTASSIFDNGLYSIPGALSLNFLEESMVIDFDGLPVFAVGGDFFTTDYDGVPVDGTIVVSLDDGTTVELSSPQMFAGFLSTQAITQLVLNPVENWATLDNFYVGQMGSVSSAESTWGAVKVLFH